MLGMIPLKNFREGKIINFVKDDYNENFMILTMEFINEDSKYLSRVVRKSLLKITKVIIF